MSNTLNPVLPEYIIERVEALSSTFNQGKIYITVDIKVNDESQLFICEQLKNRFTEFSSIIIFIYSSDLIGKSLAMGFDKKITSQKKKESWFAMYTYNSVEGSYFDNEPSGYLKHKHETIGELF